MCKLKILVDINKRIVPLKSSLMQPLTNNFLNERLVYARANKKVIFSYKQQIAKFKTTDFEGEDIVRRALSVAEVLFCAKHS